MGIDVETVMVIRFCCCRVGAEILTRMVLKRMTGSLLYTTISMGTVKKRKDRILLRVVVD